jgi:hypothetical protein
MHDKFSTKVMFFIQETFEDTKEVMIICKLEKERQHNGQKKKYKMKNYGNAQTGKLHIYK